jgi:hypothetical protein
MSDRDCSILARSWPEPGQTLSSTERESLWGENVIAGVDQIRIRPLAEADLDAVIVAAGGSRAHEEADRRVLPGADYRLGDTVIELKALDDEGLSKPERQAKLAQLFRGAAEDRPVIVLDRQRLPTAAQAYYDRVLEGPIKTAVAKSKTQLRQSRTELRDTNCSVLFVINNGYTALDHDSLVRMVAHRVRNDTAEIDGVVVAGCYFYSDRFDSFFIWPMDYVPINAERPFYEFETLRRAWNDHVQGFMTALMIGDLAKNPTKGPVIDMQFDLEGVTYIKPAPAIGRESAFYGKRRPRRGSSELEYCPPVATTFPAMTRGEWVQFREALPQEPELGSSFDEWQVHHAEAVASGTKLQPFVPITVTYDEWVTWRCTHRETASIGSIRHYANGIFEQRVREIMNSARERRPSSLLPHRYVLAVTEEIGQDRVNDVSHIASLRERLNADAAIRPLVENARIFHEHAIALAAAYAIAENVSSVLWQKDLTYAWT